MPRRSATTTFYSPTRIWSWWLRTRASARLVKRDAGARYKGVTHEYVDVSGDVGELRGVWYKDHASGSNRVDKFERDIRLLTKALEAEPDNHRYWFYLAQSYKDAGRAAEGAQTYAKRADMGGWDEEAWYARLMEARCTACRYPGIQVGPLTRLSSRSPLVCEPLLWDRAA